MTSSPLVTSRLPIWLVLTLVLLLHLPTTRTSFCGFDDFNENFRAEFEDTPAPARILTTPHFESFKYRPGNRYLTWISNRIGQGSAWPFRWRNLLMHLINVYLVYRVALLLFGGAYIPAVSAFLFGLHHLTHQNIHAAIFTNTWAYAFVLAGMLASFSMANSSRWVLLAILAAVANFVAIFSYDPALFSVGLLPLYVACRWLFTRDIGMPWRRLLVHTALQVAAVLAIFVLRRAFVPSGIPEFTPPLTLLTILISYAAAIVIPIDTVSIQSWMEVSITKQLMANGVVILLAPVAAAVLAVVVYFIYRRGWLQRVSRLDWAAVLFLLSAALLAVLPTSLGSPHPSETYTYFATALSMIFLTALAVRFLRVPESRIGRNFFWSSVGVLLVLFGTYCITRSVMVIDCGDTSRKILQTLAADPRVASGHPVRLARSPYDPPLRHVGLYGYVGLDSIGIGPFASAALRSALSNTLHRTPIDAEVISPQELNRECSLAPAGNKQPACFLIHWDGFVEPWQPRPF